MRHKTPRVILTHGSDSDPWALEVDDFAGLRDAIGSDVLNAFCRCFVHCDRLTSLVGFAKLSEDFFGSDSPAFARDLQSVLGFSIGTLRELAIAIRGLRGALRARGILNANEQAWVKLQEIERRWEDDPFFRDMRNKVAFHIDPDVTEEGLKKLAASGRVVMIKGVGELHRNSFMCLGLEALLRGHEKDSEHWREFINKISEDHDVAALMQEAFLATLESAGIGHEAVRRDSRGR